MQTLEAINKRRSIRKYENKEVSKEILEEILMAACMAPSSVNFQPWYFVALKNKDEKEKVLHIMQKVANNMKDELQERFKNNPEVVAQTLAFTKSLGSADVYILVFSQKNYASSMNNSITQSIAAAIQNLCIAAADKELGTCWMCAPVNAGFGEELASMYAKDDGKMFAMITLGYPAQTPNAPKRKSDRFKIIL